MHSRRKIQKALLIMLTASVMLLLNTTAAFATDALGTAINTSGTRMFNTIVGIASTAARAAASVALVQLLVLQNPQKIDRAKAWLIRIIIVFVLINGIGTILRFANGVGGNTMSNDMANIAISPTS